MVTTPFISIKRAFVTGATGIVGLPLCSELVSMGVRVTAYSRYATELEFPERVDVLSGDIFDAHSMVSEAVDTGLEALIIRPATVFGTEKG